MTVDVRARLGDAGSEAPGRSPDANGVLEPARGYEPAPGTGVGQDQRKLGGADPVPHV